MNKTLVSVVEVTLHCTYPPFRYVTPLIMLTAVFVAVYCCCMKRPPKRIRPKQKQKL